MGTATPAKPRYVVIVGAGVACAFLLVGEVRSGFASDIAETGAVATLLVMTAWVTRWAQCSTLVTRLVAFAIACFATGQLVDLSGGIAFFDGVPVIGSGSAIRGRLESLGFVIGLLFLFGALLFALIEVQAGRVADQRYRLLADNVSDVISISDLNLKLTYISPSVYRVRGLTPEEALRQTPEEIFTPGSLAKARALVQSELEKINRGERPPDRGATLELELVHKNGSVIPVEARVSPIAGQSGAIEGILAVTRDISERRRAEESIRQSEARFRALVENSPVCIHEIDLEGRLCSINPAGMTMIGAENPESVIGVPYLAFVAPADRDRVAAAIERGLAGEATSFLFDARRHHEVIHLISEIVPFRDEENRVVRLMGITADITGQKRAASERERLLAQLSQAQKMESVGRLAGGVAHDFNNMLGVVLGHVELALDGGESAAERQQHLLEIRDFCKRAADLTRQLLAFSRQQTVEPRALSLNDATAGVLNMLRRLIGEDIRLTWTPADGLWPVMLDPTQVDQILANLCVNARDAINGHGEIAIATRNESLTGARVLAFPSFEPGDYVHLEVRDTGHGMDPETLDRAFEPFYTTKERSKGTGLGLATVYGIVKQNKGYIELASEPNKGATISIYFPRYRGADVWAAEDRREKPGAPSGGNETILLVEDEPALLRSTGAMLGRLGYRVIAAGAPGVAITSYEAQGHDIDLVLTDVVMPEMNGRQLVRELETRNAALRTLYMSGYAGDLFGEDGVLDEGVNFVQKPFTIKALADKVRHALDNPAV